MKKKYLILISVLLLSFTGKVIEKPEKYLIVIQKVTIKQSIHNPYFYLWVIPKKTISSRGNFKAYRLFIDNFSNDNLQNCKNKDSIDIYTLTINTNYDFSEEYLRALDSLEYMINDKALLVQDVTYKKKYPSKEKKRVKLYLLPVTGDFCFCPITKEVKEKRLFFSDTISLPLGNIKYDPDFYKDEDMRQFIYHKDFLFPH